MFGNNVREEPSGEEEEEEEEASEEKDLLIALVESMATRWLFI